MTLQSQWLEAEDRKIIPLSSILYLQTQNKWD